MISARVRRLVRQYVGGGLGCLAWPGQEMPRDHGGGWNGVITSPSSGHGYGVHRSCGIVLGRSAGPVPAALITSLT